MGNNVTRIMQDNNKRRRVKTGRKFAEFYLPLNERQRDKVTRIYYGLLYEPKFKTHVADAIEEWKSLGSRRLAAELVDQMHKAKMVRRHKFGKRWKYSANKTIMVDFVAIISELFPKIPSFPISRTHVMREAIEHMYFDKVKEIKGKLESDELLDFAQDWNEFMGARIKELMMKSLENENTPFSKTFSKDARQKAINERSVAPLFAGMFNNLENIKNREEG